MTAIGNPRSTAELDGSGSIDTDLPSGAWFGMSLLYARLTRRLASTLDASGCVPLATFELLTLIERAGGPVRPTDLLGDVTLSQPGLSRKLDRLCAQGLLERTTDPNDRRTAMVGLTPAGRAALAEATPVHRAELADWFTRIIAPEQLTPLRSVLDHAEDQQPA